LASEISTIQSLKAVDAWIDVINANINGGVRTAFKSSRLKFAGSNVDIQRAGTTTSLPLQLPEAGLSTANTVIDFTQGAITASTEVTHLAIQGDGFFIVQDPTEVTTATGYRTTTTRAYLTRDGEFHTNKDGFLETSYGYLLMVPEPNPLNFNGGVIVSWVPVFNDIEGKLPAAIYGNGVMLSDFLNDTFTAGVSRNAAGGTTFINNFAIVKVIGNRQGLTYTRFGSTTFAFDPAVVKLDYAKPSDATILSKSLEASNASMTQSVPELSLAQKLFSALTKVLQTKQTNVDGVLNLVR
jgi:flagellar hook-basal body protein